MALKYIFEWTAHEIIIDNYMTCFRKKTLYVILPYFNFCGFKRRHELFMNFVNENYKNYNLKIIIVEIVGSSPLGKLPVWKHLRFRSNSILWIKENLINMGFKALPRDWKYAAWVDADITFLNTRWVNDTFDELRKCDLVQMWQTAVNLGYSGEVIKVDKSFGHLANSGGNPSESYTSWHPGYAWACTRRFYKRIGGLIDWAILGSGDRHMAMAMIGKAVVSAPDTIHPHYKALLSEFQDRVNGLFIGWVHGTIIHHWHGSLVNRKYQERWKILTQYQYDPFLDLGTTKDGIIELTTKGKRIENLIREYFISRREDS